jgi:hypothetical protein
MENACQFLYRHALLPEAAHHISAGPRVNLTFRSKTPTTPACPYRPLHRSRAISAVHVLSAHADTPSTAARLLADGAVFVGRMPAVAHRPRGFKDTLFHPFESPFIDDPAAVATARYRTWIGAQPAFLRWVCRQLGGRLLLCADTVADIAHAHTLADIVHASGHNILRAT